MATTPPRSSASSLNNSAADPPSSPVAAMNHHDHRGLDEIPSSSTPWLRSLLQEGWHSVDTILFSGGKITWLILGGPLAVLGDSTGLLGEAPCFVLAGLALIPCAERLSFVTEQVAAHTNGTIGALLNATFGNAPELLISVAALRAGYYRVVQLAMLGSMLTNLILVFGVACVIGGCRWQVQTLRITSGNVNVGMLLLACAGFLLPAILIVSGQVLDKNPKYDPDVPSPIEISYSRVNAVVLMLLYLCYLVFQLGTHKDEYDEAPEGQEVHHQSHHTAARHAQRNLFCLNMFRRVAHLVGMGSAPVHPSAQLRASISYEMVPSPKSKRKKGNGSHDDESGLGPTDNDVESGSNGLESDIELVSHRGSSKQDAYLRSRSSASDPPAIKNIARSGSDISTPSLLLSSSNDSSQPPLPTTKSKDSDHVFGNADDADGLFDESNNSLSLTDNHLENTEHFEEGPLVSMRVGVAWLFIITLCVSALSDILVDTISGFAERLHLSEVFTSMVIIPFFSNVAEQVSAFIFAYRDEMDLVIGVTVGSAVQIATFVLPGSVLIGYFLDRSMTLYFHAYETTCLVFGVICVAAVLQGGTTNWLVGAILVGVYVIIATGIWFHELEDLAVDGEVAIRNQTDSYGST